MNNKIKGSMLLILSLCFALYAVGQILAVMSSSTDKLDEPIQLISGQSYQFHYEHNIWDAFNIYNNYEVSLVFENKPAFPLEAYEVKNIKYRIHAILQNKNRILYDSIVDRNNVRIRGFAYSGVYYTIYRYNYNIYDPSRFTLILKILETDPILAELNPRLEVYNYLECGLEGLFWLPTLLVVFILFILTFVFGIKFLVKKSK